MKWAGKRMTVVITGVVAALFLCTLAVMLVRSTYKIQGTMQEEVLDLCTEAADRITAMAESAEAGETREKRIFHYQQAMADNDMGFSGSYPFRCVSALGSIGGESVPVYSRNGVFLSIVWKDGREEHISAVFAHENSADVAQVLLRNQFIYDGVFQMTGYRENGWFYVQTMDYGYGERYESPYEAPEGAQLEEIRLVFRQAGGVGEYKPEPANAKSVGIVPVLKYYGGTDQTAPFVKQWETDDALLEELLEEGFAVEGAGFAQMGALTEIKERTIFRTKIKVRERMKDSMQLCGEGYMYVGYLAEFSPLALAARELWGSWVPLILLVLFVACGLFLNTTYNYVRQREVRAYRDEIARQTQALEYAKNAESSRREMTSAIAHELKTPIAVLSSYAEALQENIDAEKQSHYLAVIREETGKMDRMVLELLDLSRLEAGKYKLQREQFNLEELAREIIEPLVPEIEAKGVALVWQVGESQVNADRYRLGQVIENFMTNAIRHTPEGGKIVLRIGMDRETLSVENQGRPIPAEQLPKVWETFFQGDASRNERGSGLGLSICRTIVALHGGSCKAENTGGGVKFSVSLSAEQKLYQLGRLPQEEIVNLTYPIARWSTTVERVMERLELLRGKALGRELRAGNIRLGDDPVTSKRTKLYAGYVLSWQEFRITIIQDDDDKRRALLVDRMRQGSLGFQDAMRNPGWVGNPL